MTTKTALIQAKAIELLKKTPEGMNTSQIINGITESLPDLHPKTINGTVWKFPSTRPGEVYKPSRGRFRHVSFREKHTMP